MALLKSNERTSAIEPGSVRSPSGIPAPYHRARQATHKQKHTHTHTHSNTHTNRSAHTHTPTHTQTEAHTHTHKQKRAHTHIHAQHTQTEEHARTHTHRSYLSKIVFARVKYQAGKCLPSLSPRALRGDQRVYPPGHGYLLGPPGDICGLSKCCCGAVRKIRRFTTLHCNR